MSNSRRRDKVEFRARHEGRSRRLALERLEERRLLSASTWLILGDASRLAPNDTILIECSPDDASVLRAVVNGQVVATRAAASVRTIKVLAGKGDDTVRVDLSAGGWAIPAILKGGSGNDLLVGGTGNDRLYGGSGNDTLVGGAGDDRLDGGPGNDSLDGGAGNDRLYGGRGADTLDGGPGDDYLGGYYGADSLYCGDGDDLARGGPGNDLLDGGAGDDRLYGGGGSDTLDGGEGTDRMDGGWGRDWVHGDPNLDSLRLGRTDFLAGDRDSIELRQAQSDDEVRQWLLDAAAQQWRDWWGAPIFFGGTFRGGDVAFATDGGFQPDAGSGDFALVSGAGTDFSSTNTQEEGVDEGDFVKTDGEYLYLLSGQELIIADAWPAEGLHEVARVKIEGNPLDLYVAADRVMVLSAVYPDDVPWLLAAGGRTYCPWRSSQLKVTVLDVSDPAAPSLAEETVLDGSIVDSRAIGEHVYLVIRNSFPVPQPILPWPDPDDPVLLGGAASQPTLFETKDDYAARLAADWAVEMPAYSTVTHGPDGKAESAGPLAEAPDIYIPSRPNGSDMLSVVLFDLGGDGGGPVSTASVLGVDGTVYASAESLYVVSHSWTMAWARWRSAEMSHVYKFGLGEDGVSLEAAGAVPGWVLNQFSMDEEDGFFRIATTSSDRDLSNNLFVLEQRGEHLDIAGALADIAVSESLYAARFMGDRGYLVTFRRVDPLFTVDLSDPYAPKLVGQLKIPGYSSYLHPMGDDCLIGLGRDADPETGWVRGLQLSLFDVSNPRRPVRIDTYAFSAEAWGGWSEAEWDHHAFSFFPEHGVLALPVELNWWGDGGLQVLRVSRDDGFAFLGQIEHDSTVRRSLRIGGYLYSVSDTTIKVNVIDAPGTQVAELRYADAEPGLPPIGIL